jgi:DNA invertase Pin-like site-specific DNA recombinase
MSAATHNRATGTGHTSERCLKKHSATSAIRCCKQEDFMPEISVSKCSLYETMMEAMKQRIVQIERVALYARVSTKDGRQDTENQLIALREYCAKQNWTITEEYVDHETGGTSKRPHFQRMFANARARKFDLVLFWSLDRLSREGVSTTLNHLERLTAAGVNWRSYTEEYLDSCGIFRDAVLSILATIAKQERVRRSERASAAITRLRRQGKTEHLGRPRLVVDREKVRRLHEQGWSVRKIAEEISISPASIGRIVKGKK